MIEVCFWCNRPKLKNQDGKPEYNNYEPCKTCSLKMRKGITVIQVTETDNGNPVIDDGIYPTGVWAVVDIDNVKKVLTNYPAIDTILKSETMYLNKNHWSMLFK